MSREKQIEEMAKDLQKSEHWYFNDHSVDFELDRKKTAENLYNAGYRKSEGEWIERPDLRGFVCSNGCGELLTELEEDAALPKFCPNCGTKMKNGTTIQEHVEILCKRLCRMKGGGK